MNIYLLLVSLISNITVELNQEEKQILPVTDLKDSN